VKTSGAYLDIAGLDSQLIIPRVLID